MKRFVFDLEPVLEIRQIKEEQAIMELGRAISELTGIQNKIKQIAAFRSKAMQERFSDNSIKNSSMVNWDNYIGRLDLDTEILMEEAVKAELIVEQKRKLYFEASKNLQIMEDLKKDDEKSYKKKAAVKEAQEMEELRRKVEGRR